MEKVVGIFLFAGKIFCDRIEKNFGVINMSEEKVENFSEIVDNTTIADIYRADKNLSGVVKKNKIDSQRLFFRNQRKRNFYKT